MIFQNTVPLVTEEIKPGDVMSVLYAFREMNSNSLLLSSNGGSAASFIGLGNHIIERNISVVGAGPVGSLAVIFFLCGKVRVATPDTTFFIHEASCVGWSGERVTKGEAQMKALICEYENNMAGYLRWERIRNGLTYIDQKEAELISQKTSLSAGMAMELMRSEHEFDIDDALRYRFIHDVVDEQQVHVLSQCGTYEPW